MKLEEKDYQLIYENLKNNSIGKEKICSSNFAVKKIALTVALTTFISVFTTACSVSLKDKLFNSKDTSSVVEVYEPTKYSRVEISSYNQLRSRNLLVDNGFTDYKIEGDYRDYNYTAEQFSTIKDLDDTYLYGFYMVVTEKTFSNILNALGYKDLNDFLVKNKYVDSENKPSKQKWYSENTKQIEQIMVEEMGEKSWKK